jgi:hypothetical protein
MATVTPKALVEGILLTGTAATLYTTPGATTAVIRSITLCNTDSVARTVTLYLIASGGSLGGLNTVLSAFSMAAGETVILDSLFVMMTGDFIQGLASVTNVVSIRVDGSEVT